MSLPNASVSDIVKAINVAISELEQTMNVAPETVLGAAQFIRVATEIQLEAAIRAQLQVKPS